MKRTFYQLADVAIKAERVCASVKRSSQISVAELYADRAIELLNNEGEYALASVVGMSKRKMIGRIKSKPTTDYNHLLSGVASVSSGFGIFF